MTSKGRSRMVMSKNIQTGCGPSRFIARVTWALQYTKIDPDEVPGTPDCLNSPRIPTTRSGIDRKQIILQNAMLLPFRGMEGCIL